MTAPRRMPKDDVLHTLRQIVAPLAEALGPGNEVVLHDLRHMDHSVIAIAGDITNRGVGAPVTDLILQHLQAGHREDLLRYRTRTKAGRQLLSSTIFARDGRGSPFGCLCINTDVTDLLHMSESLRDLAAASDARHTADLEGSSEDFVPSVEDLAVNAVNRAIETVGVPVHLMRKEHRTEVIKRLDASGFFLIQDAVVYVAAALAISRYSVYNYLREISGKDSRRDGAGQTRRATARQLPIPTESVE